MQFVGLFTQQKAFKTSPLFILHFKIMKSLIVWSVILIYMYIGRSNKRNESLAVFNVPVCVELRCTFYVPHFGWQSHQEHFCLWLTLCLCVQVMSLFYVRGFESNQVIKYLLAQKCVSFIPRVFLLNVEVKVTVDYFLLVLYI